MWFTCEIEPVAFSDQHFGAQLVVILGSFQNSSIRAWVEDIGQRGCFLGGHTAPAFFLSFICLPLYYELSSHTQSLAFTPVTLSHYTGVRNIKQCDVELTPLKQRAKIKEVLLKLFIWRFSDSRAKS